MSVVTLVGFVWIMHQFGAASSSPELAEADASVARAPGGGKTGSPGGGGGGRNNRQTGRHHNKRKRR